MQVLDLSHNLLTSLPEPTTRTWPHLKELYLHGNKWHCNCKIKWMKSWIFKYTNDTISKEIKCLSPFYNALRTLCIISNNFIESEIGKFVFSVAYAQDVIFRRKRLLMVLFENVNEERLTDELRLYVDKKSYLMRNALMLHKRLTYGLAQGKLGGPETEARGGTTERTGLVNDM